MKSVLISIQPQWCEKIFNGSKSIEVRKSRPSIPTPFKVYVYQTKHNGGKAIVSEVLNSVYGGGKVIGSFVCDRVRLCIPFGLKGHLLSQEVYREMCLTKEQLDKYGGLKTLYGWHITEPKLFDKPRELGEFKRLNRKCKYGDLGYANPNCNECKECNLTRAPQSGVLCGGQVMTEKEKQVLVEFIEQLQKKGFWTKTNNCEWAAVVKVTDIYEIAAEYGVGVEK